MEESDINYLIPKIEQLTEFTTPSLTTDRFLLICSHFKNIKKLDLNITLTTDHANHLR